MGPDLSQKPSDFYVDLVSFFSIVLPGAILTYVYLDLARSAVSGKVLPAVPGDVPAWIAFGVGAYVVGHFVFLFASLMLDPGYDVWVKWKRRGGDALYAHVQSLQGADLGANAQEMTTIDWATDTVRLRSASAFAEVERVQADSKFFRSLTVVLPLSVPALLYHGAALLVVVGVALATVAALYRFCELRWKATKFTYQYAVLLNEPQ